MINDLTNMYIRPPLMNYLFNNTQKLIEGANVIKIDQNYIYRPDRVAYDEYNNELLFPIILLANNISSVFLFNPDYMNYRCIVPNIDVVQNIIREGLNNNKITLKDVFIPFKTTGISDKSYDNFSIDWDEDSIAYQR